MIALLVFSIVVLALLFLRERKRTRDDLRRIGAMMDAIESGERPRTFILHGETALRRIGLGMERWVEQREALRRRISLEEFNLQAILAGMLEGVMVVDTERNIRLVNQSFREIFDLKMDSVGRGAFSILRQLEIDELLRKTLSTGEAQVREVELTRPRRRLAASLSPVRDSAGCILGAAATFHDITRLKELEDARRDLVANVSHELRTPLSIFQGYVELLRDHPEMPKEEAARTLDVLARHSLRLNALVQDLLTLARLESRSNDVKREPVEPGPLLRGVEEDWKPKFAAKGVRFGVEMEADLPVLQADSFRLEQVFYNLLENALKYTPEGGSVTLGAARAASVVQGAPELEFRVIDTGSGIPPEDLPHVFERFYRADKARNRAMGGTGLGLSIVKHIVGLHGGSVQAESAPGAGASLIVRLPAAGPG